MSLNIYWLKTRLIIITSHFIRQKYELFLKNIIVKWKIDMKMKTCPYRIMLVDLSKSTTITRFKILTIEKFAGKKYMSLPI